jgi:hypothetical protein
MMSALFHINTLVLMTGRLTEYSGASRGKNRKGPMMLPVVYAMNIIAEATLFLVKPATLEATIDKEMGKPAANATKIHSPKS